MFELLYTFGKAIIMAVSIRYLTTQPPPTGADLEGEIGGPPVGSRGEAPAGGWGTESPEAGAFKKYTT